MTLRSYDATYDVFNGYDLTILENLYSSALKQNRRGYGDRESVRNRTIVVCHPREIVRLEGYDQFTVTLR